MNLLHQYVKVLNMIPNQENRTNLCEIKIRISVKS